MASTGSYPSSRWPRHWTLGVSAEAMLTGTTPGLREATIALVSGPIALQFWVLRVFGGLLVPAVLIAMPLTRTPAGTLAASLLVLVGVLTDRFTFVTAGQIAPTTTAAGTVSYPYASYSPSLVELAIFAGALAFLALTYTLAERYLDMGETDVHVGINWPWVRRRAAAHHAEPAAIGPDTAPSPASGGIPALPTEAAAIISGGQS